MQTDTTLLDVTCQRPFAHPVAYYCVLLHVIACCYVLLRVVSQSLKLVELLSQQLPTFLLFCDRLYSHLFQNCWGHARTKMAVEFEFAKSYGLYPFHDALQAPALLRVVASVCTPLLTRAQQLPTLLAQQCWELLRPFVRSLRGKTKEKVITEEGRSTNNVYRDIHHAPKIVNSMPNIWSAEPIF